MPPEEQFDRQGKAPVCRFARAAIGRWLRGLPASIAAHHLIATSVPTANVVRAGKSERAEADHGRAALSGLMGPQSHFAILRSTRTAAWASSPGC